MFGIIIYRYDYSAVYRDKTNFKSESYWEDMVVSVNDFVSNVNDLTKLKFIEAFETYVQLIHKVIV